MALVEVFALPYVHCQCGEIVALGTREGKLLMAHRHQDATPIAPVILYDVGVEVLTASIWSAAEVSASVEAEAAADQIFPSPSLSAGAPARRPPTTQPETITSPPALPGCLTGPCE